VRGMAGMIYSISQQRAAREMLGVVCHKEAAAVAGSGNPRPTVRDIKKGQHRFVRALLNVR
jgi:hypothetical protein